MHAIMILGTVKDGDSGTDHKLIVVAIVDRDLWVHNRGNTESQNRVHESPPEEIRASRIRLSARSIPETHTLRLPLFASIM